MKLGYHDYYSYICKWNSCVRKSCYIKKARWLRLNDMFPFYIKHGLIKRNVAILPGINMHFFEACILDLHNMPTTLSIHSYYFLEPHFAEMTAASIMESIFVKLANRHLATGNFAHSSG